jgi:hypothetical protein
MKIFISILTLSLVSFSVQAEEIRCKIKNQADAVKCMDRVAETAPTDNGAADSLVTKFTQVPYDLLLALGASDSDVEMVRDADFVGAVLTDQDEYHLMYYVLNKGNNVKPELVYDLNTVDLSSSFPKKLKKDSVLAKTKNYFLGYSDQKRFNAWDFVQEQIDAALNPDSEEDSVTVAATSEAKITCNIKTQRDATTCMQRIAETETNDVNESNDALVSTNWGPAVTVFNGLGNSEEMIQKLKKADFVAVVLAYTYAENHLIYYAVKKGKNVTPERLSDENVVDLTSYLPKKLKRTSPLANPDTYLLGYDSKKYTTMRDSIVEELEELFSNQDQ